MRLSRRSLVLPGLSLPAMAVIFAACGGDGRSPVGLEPLAPARPPSQMVAVECRASMKSLGMSCQVPRGSAGAASGVFLGQQNVDVRLSTNDVAVVADTFAFDLNIQNVLPQPTSGPPQRLGVDSLGTAHPIQIFFIQGPLALGNGGGSVMVVNEDGTGTFTSGNQPYFEYPVVLDPGEVSPDRRWKLLFSPEVDSLAFVLMVSAAVPRPAGWVDVSPASALLAVDSSVVLTGSIRNYAGRLEVFDEPIAWSSSNPAVASVNSSTGVVTAHSEGSAVITASTLWAGRYGTSVVVVGDTAMESAMRSGRSASP